MYSPFTLLISSAGRRCGLIDCFRIDANYLGIPLKIIATDCDPVLSPACYRADHTFKVPRCSELNYLDEMLAICERHEVDLLVPTIDTELAVLSRNQGRFEMVGTKIVVSGPEVVAVAGDKLATADLLAGAGISVPKTICLDDYLRRPDALQWPVIAKPRAGSASHGIIRPKVMGDLTGINPDGYLVQELWCGREYTINIFFDSLGVLRCVVPHERLEIRSGEVSKGITRCIPAFERIAEKMALVLPGARGPICFQAIASTAGEFAVFEINARFGGGFPLAHRAGARFSQWLLEEAYSLPLTASNKWKRDVTMLRYDMAVFIND